MDDMTRHDTTIPTYQPTNLPTLEVGETGNTDITHLTGVDSTCSPTLLLSAVGLLIAYHSLIEVNPLVAYLCPLARDNERLHDE